MQSRIQVIIPLYVVHLFVIQLNFLLIAPCQEQVARRAVNQETVSFLSEEDKFAVHGIILINWGYDDL